MKKIIIAFLILLILSLIIVRIIGIGTLKKEYAPLSNQVEELVPSENVIEITINDDPDNPEITDRKYDQLTEIEDVCQPGLKKEIQAALDNDGIIRQDEYAYILNRCASYIELEHHNAKQRLQEYLKD